MKRGKSICDAIKRNESIVDPGHSPFFLFFFEKGTIYALILFKPHVDTTFGSKVVKVALLKDTGVTTGTRTHTLLLRNTRA